MTANEIALTAVKALDSKKGRISSAWRPAT